MTVKPTEKQIERLRCFDLEDSYLPTTKAVARVLLSFIIDGNGTNTGSNPFARAAYFRKFHDNWVGQKVKHFDQRTGIVKRVIARGKTEVRQIQRSNPVNPAPFVLGVTWDNGTYSEVCVSSITKVNDVSASL